jgi:hypothetical protein
MLFWVMGMNTIKRKIIIYILIILFLTAALFQFFSLHSERFTFQSIVLIVFIIAGEGIIIYLLLNEIMNLKTAGLIKENFILKVKTAVISEITGKDTCQKPIVSEDSEIYVSYFGILYNGKIAKFNQDGIRLKAMVIGSDFISFTYGNEKQMQNLRIVRPDIEPEAMNEMINKFRFETGITPTIIDG